MKPEKSEFVEELKRRTEAARVEYVVATKRLSSAERAFSKADWEYKTLLNAAKMHRVCEDYKDNGKIKLSII